MGLILVEQHSFSMKTELLEKPTLLWSSQKSEFLWWCHYRLLILPRLEVTAGVWTALPFLTTSTALSTEQTGPLHSKTPSKRWVPGVKLAQATIFLNGCQKWSEVWEFKKEGWVIRYDQQITSELPSCSLSSQHSSDLLEWEFRWTYNSMINAVWQDLGLSKLIINQYWGLDLGPCASKGNGILLNYMSSLKIVLIKQNRLLGEE